MACVCGHDITLHTGTVGCVHIVNEVRGPVRTFCPCKAFTPATKEPQSMITIVDATQKKVTTLNDIPIGQVFRGRIVGRTGTVTGGIFYKAEGNFQDGMDREGRVITVRNYDCLVVRLDKAGKGVDGYANAWTRCVEVQDYEPLEATITLKKV